MLHRNGIMGARERRQLIPHVCIEVPILWPENQLESGLACAGLLCSCSGFVGNAKFPNCGSGLMDSAVRLVQLVDASWQPVAYGKTSGDRFGAL